jgi:hypothetical protein
MPQRDSEKYTAEMFLSLFALKRGWITGASNPNLSQAAK